jgi:hypothetical protein
MKLELHCRKSPLSVVACPSRMYGRPARLPQSSLLSKLSKRICVLYGVSTETLSSCGLRLEQRGRRSQREGGAAGIRACRRGPGARFWSKNPKTQKPTSTARPPLFLGRRSPKPGNQPVTGGPSGLLARHEAKKMPIATLPCGLQLAAQRAAAAAGSSRPAASSRSHWQEQEQEWGVSGVNPTTHHPDYTGSAVHCSTHHVLLAASCGPVKQEARLWFCVCGVGIYRVGGTQCEIQRLWAAARRAA